MKICSTKDINKAIDKVFRKASKTALSVNLLNDSTLQVDITRASSNTIKRPDQAIKIAQKIKKDVLNEFRESGFNEDFIAQFNNDIVRITDYSDIGKVILKKVVSPRLVEFIESSADIMQTEEELFQEAKSNEAISTVRTYEESIYQQAEQLGITREEHDLFKQNKLDYSLLISNTSQESNSVIYEDNVPNYFNQLEDTARSFSAAPSPVQNFTNTKFDNYVKFKQNQKYRLDKKIAQLKKLKKENIGNEPVLKALNKAEENLRIYLEGDNSKNIKGVIQDIEQINSAKDFNRILFSAQNDIGRVRYLATSQTAENLAEAKEIISFYKAASDFSLAANQENPLFHTYDIANEFDESNIPSVVMNAMKEIYKELEPIEMLINNKEQQTIMSNLNNLEQIKNNPNLTNNKSGVISYRDIFYKDSGLKDITMAESYFFDPGTAFIRENGVVPQAMQVMLENAYSDAHTYTKEVVEKVDGMLPRVTKVLRDMGYSSKVFGKNIGVDWDIFRAKDSNGLLRDGIVQRYTGEFIDSLTEMKTNFQDNVRRALDPNIDPKNRNMLLENIHSKRNKWLKDNTVVIDVRKIPELQSLFPTSGSYLEDNGTHVQELKNLLGEEGYKEEIQKQITRLQQYESALANEKDKLSAITGTAYLAKLQQFINRNSPYIAAENYYNGTNPTRGPLVDFTNMKYNYFVPLNKNNFYDKNFETIESNPDLKEFHSLMMDVIENIQENLTPELQSKLSTTSLPQLQKPLMEIFADPHLTMKAKMSAAFTRFMDFIRSLYSINPQSYVDNSLVDLVTGKRLDQVNSSFLQGAKEEITRRTTFMVDSFKRLSDVSLSEKKTIKYAWNGLSPSQIGFLQENLHPKQVIEMKNSPSKIFDIAKVLKDNMTNNVISEGSFDLPKIAKLYTTLTMEFSARNSVLPNLKLMMEHYKLIKDPNQTQQGNSIINKITGKTSVKGERLNSIAQIESWFNRVALGNYAKENEFGMTKSTERDLLNKKEKEQKLKFQNLIKDINEQLKNTSDLKEKSQLGKKVNYYEAQIRNLGRKKSLSAFVDANFAFIRALGLGWNVSSQVTNLIEGQISNMTLGASGNYYSPQNLERANNIVLGSILKNASFGKLSTPGAKKASAIMHKFDVMQDATNELQKASNKNPLDNVNKFLAPFALISKVEYLNQTPVVIAILMDQQITDIDGNISNIWDAMNPDGSLQEKFKTEENVQNWEKGNGDQYKKFTTTVGQAISFQHGDYSDVRGNRASEEITGKVVLMFKRWATMWLQSRFAMPHVSVRSKDHVMKKGRFRSSTTTTGALTGGIFGATLMSGALTSLGVAIPALLPVAGGAILGGYLAKRLGINSSDNNRSKEVFGVDTVMQEAAMTMKYIALKMIGVPVNLVAGKQVIKHNPQFDSENNPTLAVDARNFRANISELALQFTLLGMAAIVRGMWGDDPEDEKKYNLMSNRIGKLLKQTTMLFDISDMHTLITDFAVIRYVENIRKFLVEFAPVFGTEDLAIMKSGPHKGELKVLKTFKSAFLPSLLRDKDPLTFGFGTDLDKFYEFNTIGIVGAASHGTPDEKAKEELNKIKKDLKKEYIENIDGLSDKDKKDREKMINKLLAKPPKGSYLDLLENVQQYIDALAQSYGEDGDPSLLDEAPSRKEVEEQFNMEGDIYPDEEEQEEIDEETEE